MSKFTIGDTVIATNTQGVIVGGVISEVKEKQFYTHYIVKTSNGYGKYDEAHIRKIKPYLGELNDGTTVNMVFSRINTGRIGAYVKEWDDNRCNMVDEDGNIYHMSTIDLEGGNK